METTIHINSYLMRAYLFIYLFFVALPYNEISPPLPNQPICVNITIIETRYYFFFFFNFFGEFHSNGQIVGELGAFIALILKRGAISIKDFRPISLIGSLYKILAKVLANRLSKVLNEVISKTQSAIVDGRQILDNTLIARVS